MRPIVFRTLLPAVLFLLLPAVSAAEGNIAIMVDGLPLDAKAVAIRDEVYIPAWILENYAHTRINWLRRSNLLEIQTGPPPQKAIPSRGKLKVKIGFYLESEGFVIGRNTRMYVINVDPKEFQFPDGKMPSDRAHEGALERIGTDAEAVREYLGLPPTERFSSKGWRIVARMPKEEIAKLSATVDRYELLYRSLYYDLMTNLVIQKEQQVNQSVVIDESLKGIRIENVPVRDDGSADFELGNGLYFLYARMLYRNRQIVWDIPVTMRGGETTIELSNRNAAIMQ